MWFVWAIMFLIALGCIVQFGKNIPLAEDWTLVAPLTGNEPAFIEWIWSQNNEHRLPLPRLILLGLLKITHGDFRAGMVFNTVILALLSGSMLLAVRHLRGGRIIFTDAFFPIAFLNVGNWPNLFWSWQVSFVVPTALICSVFLVIIRNPTLATPRAAIFSGVCMVLLPFCGGVGLLFMPFFTVWLLYCGYMNWRKAKTIGKRQGMSIFFFGSVLLALGLCIIYFIGYKRPYWNPPSPGFDATLETAAHLLALSLGPAASESWKLSTAAILCFLLVAVGVGLHSILRQKGIEWPRAAGVLLFFGNLTLFALVMGWGRAGLVPSVGLPIRYVLLIVPILCVTYFIWDLYGPPRIRATAQIALLVITCALLPFNMKSGLKWGEWYRKGMETVAQDILAGDPPNVLAERHRNFLIHWWDKNQLEEKMQMLKEAGIGPFVLMQDDPAEDKSGVYWESVILPIPDRSI